MIIQYIAVCNAVRNFHKNDTLGHENPNIRFNDKEFFLAKSFKTYLCESISCKPTSEIFWYYKFNITVEKDHWLLAIETTHESRLRELNWKILCNIYPTNILLTKLGIAPNNKCSFCTDTVDYIEHFFVECHKICKVWKLVADRFYVKFGVNVRISNEEALLGIIRKDGFSKAMLKYINHLILVAKMCVGKYKYGTPSDITFMFDKECIIRKL